MYTIALTLIAWYLMFSYLPNLEIRRLIENTPDSSTEINRERNYKWYELAMIPLVFLLVFFVYARWGYILIIGVKEVLGESYIVITALAWMIAFGYFAASYDNRIERKIKEAESRRRWYLNNK